MKGNGSSPDSGEMKKGSRRLVFFDLMTSGHHVEYLAHVLRFARHSELTCVVDPVVVERLPDYGVDPDDRQRARFLYPSREDWRRIRTSKTEMWRGCEELRVLGRVVEQDAIDVCYLMEMNKYQYAIGTRMGRSIPADIRGILLNPLGKTGKAARDFFLGARKRSQIRWMLRNRRVERVFLLNDDEKAEQMDKRFGRPGTFRGLKDPVVPYGMVCGGKSGATFIQKSERIRFLLFGSLSERKGVFVALKALNLIHDEMLGRFECVFAGEVNEPGGREFLKTLEELMTRRPMLRVLVVNRFLTNEETASLFSSSDCVLAPYLESESSSGVIGHAAMHGKPIIGSSEGLPGRIICRYGLGVALGSGDSHALASAMARFVRGELINVSETGMKRYVQERRPEVFVRTLLED